MSHDSSSVELFIEYVHETDGAVLIRDPDAGDVWIPKSQLVDFPNNSFNRGEPVEIVCSEWFAKKNDLI